jgi:hypothetical protein
MHSRTQPDHRQEILDSLVLLRGSSAQRLNASGKFQHDARGNCLLRIETVRAQAIREKRETEAKTQLKIRLKQVENP